MDATVKSLTKGTPKFSRKNAAVVAAILLAADEVLPTEAEESESIGKLLAQWTSPSTGLSETIATGEKLQGAVAAQAIDWFNKAVTAVRSLPPSVLDNAVEQVVHPDPTDQPYGSAPTVNLDTLPKYSDGAGTYKVVAVEGSGDSERYTLQDESGSGKPFKVSKDEILIHYYPVGGRRKTRRGKRKARRTVKRRAKSLRRRVQ